MLFNFRSCGCIFFILLIVIGCLGVAIFGWQAMPLIMARILNEPISNPQVLFDSSSDLYPTYAETPQEIRPGQSFDLILRGAEYRPINANVVITYTLTTKNLDFIRSIDPLQEIVKTEPAENWIMEPVIIRVETSKLSQPPDTVIVDVSETLAVEGQSLKSETGSVWVDVDRSRIPIDKLTAWIVSVVVFLIGVFGVFVLSKV
jgi:hypothetical protein